MSKDKLLAALYDIQNVEADSGKMQAKLETLISIVVAVDDSAIAAAWQEIKTAME